MGKTSRELTENDKTDRNAEWSTGTIVFESKRDGNYEIYKIRRPTETIRSISAMTREKTIRNLSGHLKGQRRFYLNLNEIRTAGDYT